MRRIAALALALCLAATAVASAATPRAGKWKATKVQLGYDLSFKVSKDRKRITNIVANVLESCDGSSTRTTTTIAPDASWRIKNGRFSGRKREEISGVTVYVTFQGRFTSATKATGTIRMETIVAGSTCDTFKLKFTAKRG